MILHRLLKQTILAIGLISAAAIAQEADHTVTPLDLTAAQARVIYLSISKIAKNNASPIGFRPAIGVIAPVGVVLEPVPATVAQLVPQSKDLQAALVEGEVLFIDPRVNRVVAVISGEGD
jgi:hypothetical protein